VPASSPGPASAAGAAWLRDAPSRRRGAGKRGQDPFSARSRWRRAPHAPAPVTRAVADSVAATVTESETKVGDGSLALSVRSGGRFGRRCTSSSVSSLFPPGLLCVATGPPPTARLSGRRRGQGKSNAAVMRQDHVALASHGGHGSGKAPPWRWWDSSTLFVFGNAGQGSRARSRAREDRRRRGQGEDESVCAHRIEVLPDPAGGALTARGSQRHDSCRSPRATQREPMPWLRGKSQRTSSP
jgi:hypothetical protein